MAEPKLKKVLVTGAFGFLGGRLSAYLASLGHEVTMASRTKRRPPVNNPHCRILSIDWESVESIRDAVTGHDAVVHCIGLNATESSKDPALALRVNGEYAGILSRECAKASVERLICLSTAHVYRAPLVGYIDEQTPTVNNHPYALSNRFAEQRIDAELGETDTTYCLLRLANVFGVPEFDAPDCWHLLINDLCRQAAHSGRMVISSPVDSQRSFLSAECFSSSINTLITSPTCPPVMNLGGRVLSLSQVCDAVAEVFTEHGVVRPAIATPFVHDQPVAAPLVYSSRFARSFGIECGSLYEELSRLVQYCLETAPSR
jgi:UDP-glucose 4-epimerase